MALDPTFSALKVHLAQLLFQAGDRKQALRQLEEALSDERLPPDARLEVDFYDFAYGTPRSKRAVISIRDRIERGERSFWDLNDTVVHAAGSDAARQRALETIVQVMRGERDVAALRSVEEM